MIRRLGIGKYLLLTTSLLAVATLGLGAFAFFSASVNVAEMSAITEKISGTALRTQRLLESFASLHAKFSPLITESDVDQLEKLSKDIKAGYASVEEVLDACGADCQDQQMYYDDYKAKFQAAADKYLKSGDRPAAMNSLISELDPQWQKALKKFSSDRQALTKYAEFAIVESRSTARDIKVSILLLVGGIVVASLGLGWMIRRALVNHIAALADNLVMNSTQLKGASTQLSGSSMGLSSAVSEQGVALQETMASLEEMTKVVERNAEFAKTSEHSALESQKTAEEGKQALSDLLIALEDIEKSNERIRNETDANTREFDQIVKVISEIGDKTKVINEIVFQTKLLSFNASVEAARAGEHGRGFSVVAEEVGNLAKMSGAAATEISGLLANSTRLVAETVEKSRHRVAGFAEESRSKMENGMGVAGRCSEVFDQITSRVKDVAHMVREISTASQEQSIGVGQISRTMHTLEQISQQNSGVATETAAAAQQISGQAGHLNDAVSNLRSLIDGRGSEERKAS